MRTDAVVVGAGPAGLAMSEALANRRIGHVVLERGLAGDTWRNQRWDSFRLNTPAWMNALRNERNVLESDGESLTEFLTAAETVSALSRVASMLPVRVGVSADRLSRSGSGFRLETPDGEIYARSVVIATGKQNVARRPPLAEALPDRLLQLTAADYRNASVLPSGAVLVVGSAQSGCQIAEDLVNAGRRVYLATSRVGRMPWRYRGRESLAWLTDSGFYDVRPKDLDDPALMHMAQPLVASGGRSLSLQSLAASGVVMLPRLAAIADEVLTFTSSAADHIAFGDSGAASLRKLMEDFINRSGASAPEDEPDATERSVAVAHIETLDLRDADISTVVWCTGFGGDFSWIDLPVVDELGRPLHEDGVSPVAGLFFMGFPWLMRRGSGILFGFPGDAEVIAGRVASGLAS